MPPNAHPAPHALIDDLRATLRGAVIDRSDARYDDARRVWNGLIDRYPAVIARCADRDDVVATMRLARRHRPPISIRGGGHQVAGSAVCDDGLVIDLSEMRGVEVDPERRTADVEGGATWADVDAATQRHGLAAPGGEVSSTGVGGFTLGGGMALTMRRFGLACDRLRSVEVVTADGEVRVADRDRHGDLFWAARGGGRGIGVVTAFCFDLEPLGPEVATATVVYPIASAAAILRRWRDLAPAMPESVTPQLVLWGVPPDPAIPASQHGAPCVIAAGMYAGPAEDGAAVLEPLRTLATPLHDLSGTLTYLDQQSSLDDLFPAGGRYFMKSLGVDDLDDGVIATLTAWFARRPTPETLVAIRTLGGAVRHVGPDESAFPHRADRFNVSIDAGWTDPALDAEAIGWARGLWNALRPASNGGVYVNFAGLDDDSETLGDDVYRSSAERLAAIRAAHDPEGLLAGAARRP